MVVIERLWHLSSESKANVYGKANVYRWDGGNEIWELDSDSIKHYRVISRNFTNESQTEMKEVLETLPETAVPMEIFNTFALHSTQWTFTQSLFEKESDEETTDSWDWTPLQDCIPPSILYMAPSPTVEDPVEWYVKQENSN